MYFLDICTNASFDPIWKLIGYLVNAIMIGVPIILIVLGMIDLGKAVIASKEDEVKKATKAFGKRFLYAVGVFAVVWLVTFVFDMVSGLGIEDVNKDTTGGWNACWCRIRGGDSDSCNK